MHGFGAGDLASGDQCGNVEIALSRRWRADTHAFVGELDVHGVGVGRRMHGDGRNAQFLAGAQHTQGDLTAIRDQDLVKHPLYSMIIRGCPYSTGCLSSMNKAVTVPDRAATMSLNVFMASTISTRSP